MAVLVTITILYEKFKQQEDYNDEFNHYNLVKKYLLTDSSLARSKKPLMWIHVDYDINARWWESFASRNSTCLNQPYFYLTIKSIIDKCGEDFNICLINDNTFTDILPGWTIDLSTMANPLREHFRLLALANTLHLYGGILVPPTFICFKSLGGMYYEHCVDNKMFVGEFIDNNITSAQVDFFPNPMLMGCMKECPKMGEFISYLEILNSNDYTNEMDFLGEPSRWCYKGILENTINKVGGDKLGVMTDRCKGITLELLLGATIFTLSDYALGLYIPADQILKRTSYQWFARLSPAQVLNSDTMIGKYLLAATDSIVK